MSVKNEVKAEQYPDRAGCLGSYRLDSDLNPVGIELPPDSYWWRINRKHFKVYRKAVVVGDRTRADLKRVPDNAVGVTIESEHEKHRSSSYEVEWGF